MNELKDIAIIYKLNVNFNKLEYIPYKVISGIYDEVNEELDKILYEYKKIQSM